MLNVDARLVRGGWGGVISSFLGDDPAISVPSTGMTIYF